ncbi:hypothetical protein [Streptomyces nanshensis]|uniref:Uncharacterized protein n=1 Tax=Streptomyces nanshensis TaxID=518642 RepID=A0A1E7L5P3_9ACTN|nr:hypothetical protein [Streptomyces nanshensis]OEV11516.1 hypothetical protein AN218_12490 [Streptomyces nanshensis]
MARDIGMAEDASLYRAVITKTYADGATYTHYEGPYAKPGQARGRVSFWRRHFQKTKPGASADGHIEECRPQWRRVAEPSSRPRT